MLPAMWATLSAILVACTLALSAASAHEGDDHGAPASAAGPVSPRAVATSENYQLVAIVEGETLVIYLDRATDNAPVTEARIEITLDGKPYTAERQRNGTYEISAPMLKTPGAYEVLASITEGGKSDLLVGSVTVPKSGGQNPAAHSIFDHIPLWGSGLGRTQGSQPAGWPGIIGAGLVLSLAALLFWRRTKRGARALALICLTTLAASSQATETFAHEGHDDGVATSVGGNGPQRRPDGMIFLPKPTQRLLEVRTRIVRMETAIPSRRFAGRVIANPNLSGVVQSTIQGRYIAPEGGVPPIGTKVRAGDLLGRVAPSFASIDASQIAQSMAELDQQITLARAKLARLEPLLISKAVAVAQVDEARITLDGLLKRRADLVASKVQAEDLRSPVDGVIAGARVMSGQVVNPTDQIFQIIEPASLMVEALVFGLSSLDTLSSATALLTDDRTVRLRYVGRSRALQQQYAQVQFAVVDGDGSLDVGLPVKVVAQAGAPVTGIVVPRAALTQAPNGQTVVFVQKEPEVFEPKPVRFEPFDAESVRILAGIEHGETIVVRNAPLVAQVR